MATYSAPTSYKTIFNTSDYQIAASVTNATNTIFTGVETFTNNNDIFTGNLAIGGKLNITNTQSAAAGVGTGALQVAGGIYVGGPSYFAVSSFSAGHLVFSANRVIQMPGVTPLIQASASTAYSTSAVTGTIQTSGGIGIGGPSFFGSSVMISGNLTTPIVNITRLATDCGYMGNASGFSLATSNVCTSAGLLLAIGSYIINYSQEITCLTAGTMTYDHCGVSTTTAPTVSGSSTSPYVNLSGYNIGSYSIVPTYNLTMAALAIQSNEGTYNVIITTPTTLYACGTMTFTSGSFATRVALSAVKIN